jgi:hypothetical protein
MKIPRSGPNPRFGECKTSEEGWAFLEGSTPGRDARPSTQGEKYERA